MQGFTHTSLSDRIRRRYDDFMYRPHVQAYYGQSGFYNFGYWGEDTRSPHEACEALMAQLLALMPDTRGRILDVACGLGATTRYLLQYYPASAVVGINLSAKQLVTSQRQAPGCRFFRMDATHLAFGAQVFEHLLCVESAFHFETRAQFLAEAYRVLTPGGAVVLSDILFRRVPGPWQRYIPQGNVVTTIEAYRAVYRQAGFSQVDIIEATHACWRGFRRHLLRWLGQSFLAREIGAREMRERVLWLLVLTAILKHYVLVSATKG
jgi:MPBQ/MSBQ methyltransferase